MPARANCIQRAAQEHIVDRAVHFASRLASATWEHQDDTRILSSMERSGERERPDLVADLVDNLDEAAQFDPMPFLPSPIRKLLSDPSKLFTFVGRGPGAKSRFTAGRRDEYIKLVVARLRNGQLGLVSEPLAGGTVFPVSKAGGRLREVWHGKALTQQTVRPPKPPGLAGPSAFPCLEASAEHPLRMSKRDGKCLFDQELLPEALRPYMARPAVRRRELLDAGVSESDLTSFAENCCDAAADVLYPVSRAWCMGFGWSSYVTQAAVLGLCTKAGLSDERLLAPERVAPISVDPVFSVATDDVMIFSTGAKGTTSKWAQNLDAVFESHSMLKNADKDVDDVINGTAIGIDSLPLYRCSDCCWQCALSPMIASPHLVQFGRY